MRRLIAICVVAACGGQQGPDTGRPARPEDSVILAPPWQVADAGVDAAVARMSDRMRADPVGAMHELGVRDDDFEQIARALYTEWRKQHPQPASVTVAPQPARPKAITFWCFQGNGSGLCGLSEEKCIASRATTAGGVRTPCGPPLTKTDCERITGDVAGYTPCVEQPKASCYLRRVATYGQDDYVCFPHPSMCAKHWDATDRKAGDLDVVILGSCELKP